VLDAHLLASDRIRPPVDLVLWPEDVVDVSTEGAVDASPEGADVAAVAVRLDAPLVAGVVEDAGPEHFRNASVVWSAEGQIIDRYDKVHRVPFGEYVPGRSLIKHVVNLDVISRDALAGRGPGLIRTPVGRFGVVISYEVFFADRARAATRAGGSLLLVPTNASSFKTSQVPSTEVATAQLRAIENGRDLAQAAPTGFGGFIDNHGRLLQRTVLSRRQVLQRTMHLRTGRTLYVRFGDTPVALLAVALVTAGWAMERRLKRRSRRPAQP
jgi:apolipoprotein N-acyltransferase